MSDQEHRCGSEVAGANSVQRNASDCAVRNDVNEKIKLTKDKRIGGLQYSLRRKGGIDTEGFNMQSALELAVSGTAQKNWGKYGM